MNDEAGRGAFSEVWATVCGKISAGLDVAPELHPVIYGGVLEEVDWSKPYYWVCLLSSCGIATLGLAQNSPAVIIGAMLLSPLMAPIIGLGLALAIGDLYLGVRAFINCIISTAAVVGMAALITFVLPFKETTAEVLSRTRPNPLDLFIALFCGLVAAVSVAKSYKAGPGMALPGVAIAVALVPPLCVAGWGLGSGFHMRIFRGAMVLFMTNLTAIVFLSLLVFLALGMGSRAEASAIRGVLTRYEGGGLIARWIHSHPWAERFRRVGGLRSRILLAAVAVALLYIPLHSGLRQVKRELFVNREVRSAVRTYLADFTILSRRVTPTADGAEVHLTLISERRSPAEAVLSLESYLKGRLGTAVSVGFTEVAKGSYPVEPAQADAATPQQRLHELVALVRSGALADVRGLWPEGSGYALADVSLVVPAGAEPPGIRIWYIADEEIPPAALEAFRLAARRSLSLPPLAVESRRIPRSWGRLELGPRTKPRSLGVWAEGVGARATGLPAGVNLEATLRYPQGAHPEEVERYRAMAAAALEGLAARPGMASQAVPKELLVGPSGKGSGYELLLEAKPPGASPTP